MITNLRCFFHRPLTGFLFIVISLPVSAEGRVCRVHGRGVRLMYGTPDFSSSHKQKLKRWTYVFHEEFHRPSSSFAWTLLRLLQRTATQTHTHTHTITFNTQVGATHAGGLSVVDVRAQLRSLLPPAQRHQLRPDKAQTHTLNTLSHTRLSTRAAHSRHTDNKTYVACRRKSTSAG